MDDDAITPIKDFAGKTTDITLKDNHTWIFAVYV